MRRQTGVDYARLTVRIARHRSTDVAFSIISFHEQVLGCHAYINQACRTRDILHGYEMLARVLQDFAAAPVIPFDAAAATMFEQLQAQQVRVHHGFTHRRQRLVARFGVGHQECARLQQSAWIADRRLDSLKNVVVPTTY